MMENADEKTAFQVERLAFFSDAVFAIAITLLALNIRTPSIQGEVTEEKLWQALAWMTPSLIGFVLSFLVIGIYWRAHHRLFRWVRNYDPKLVSINMWLLLFVSFIPCPTAFFSAYPNFRAPLIFYCVSLGLVGLVNYRLWRYVRHTPDLLDPSAPPFEFRLAGQRSLLIPVVFSAAAALSIVDLWAARVVMMVAPAVMALYTRQMRRRHG